MFDPAKMGRLRFSVIMNNGDMCWSEADDEPWLVRPIVNRALREPDLLGDRESAIAPPAAAARAARAVATDARLIS